MKAAIQFAENRPPLFLLNCESYTVDKDGNLIVYAKAKKIQAIFAHGHWTNIISDPPMEKITKPTKKPLTKVHTDSSWMNA